jgi:hypothetical protein
MMAPQLCQPTQFELASLTACGLMAAHENVPAIHILACQRPSYTELFAVRQWATTCDLTMTVPGDGAVCLRQNSRPSGHSRSGVCQIRSRRVAELVRWEAATVAWLGRKPSLTALRGLSEGTR